jgi:hypothetical protein
VRDILIAHIKFLVQIITIGNGKIAPFWDSPWLEGERPKDIAPYFLRYQEEKVNRGTSFAFQKLGPKYQDGCELDSATYSRIH